MSCSFNIIFTLLLGISAAQECGIGSQCRTYAGVTTCNNCPGGTVCIQETTLSDLYCQYTFCLPQGMFCEGHVGTCCSGMECGLATTDAAMKTCNVLSNTATTTTAATTTAATTTAATTAQATSTQAIVIVTDATTTSTATTAAYAPCLTEGGAKIGLPCVFPFTNKGVTYTSCTTSGGFDKPWCSTATDMFGIHVLGNWGECNAACQTEQDTTTAAPAACTTTSGADAGKRCVFPFTHKGVVHTACTYAGGFSKPWCSTRVDYWGRHKEEYWGNCDNTCEVESLWG